MIPSHLNNINAQCAKLGALGNFNLRIPWARSNALMGDKIDPVELRLLLSLWGELDILRTAKSPLPPVRPGVGRYVRFFAIARRLASPTKTEAAEVRGATFNHGMTFNKYRFRLTKSSILMGHSPTGSPDDPWD